MPNNTSRLAVASALLIAVSGCSGKTATDDEPKSGSSPRFADASADCTGCEYTQRGLERPNRLWVAAGYLYVEDWGAAQLWRLPLSGGDSEVISEGSVPQTFAVTDTHLYFAAPDPVDDGYKIVRRVSHAGAELEQVVRYLDAGEIIVGLAGETPVLKGVADTGGASLLKVAADGAKVTVRQWPSAAESPLSGCVQVLPDAGVVWCDREDGLWSASSLSARGSHDKTGWMAGELELTTSGLLVASAPIGGHSIYLRDTDGTLTPVASSDEAIGSPRIRFGSGVAWIKGGVRLTNVEGETQLLADSRGKLATSAEGIAASGEHVFFTGHRGAEPWSVYRVAAPR